MTHKNRNDSYEKKERGEEREDEGERNKIKGEGGKEVKERRMKNVEKDVNK